MSKLKSHIALIGYRACGKTTLGRLLSQTLHVECVDVDQHIEGASGRRISEIFAQSGEAVFRDLETQALEDLCTRETPLILSTGGGCILRSENRNCLVQHCQAIVYLAAPAAVLSARLSANAGDRPSLTGLSIVDEVERVLAEREALYRSTATHVVNAHSDLETLVQTLVKIVEN